MSHLGFPLEKNEGDGDDDDNYSAIPLHFPFFLASNLAALHHTRRGRTKTCPSFPSLLFSSLLFSSLPLPLPSLFSIWSRQRTAQEGATA